MRNTKSRNILMLVEGKKTEVKLFQKILSCFPEIQMNPENILVYNTNIWALNKSLMSVFGEEWYLAEDIEFIEFLESLDDSIRGKKITDIFLVFDYERQDPLFDEKILEQMLRFFHNSTENGQLYLNYPMIESYKHLKKPFPAQEYLNRKCACGALLNYKSIVNRETSFMDVRRLEKEDLKQLVIHNLCKASYMIKNFFSIRYKESDHIERYNMNKRFKKDHSVMNT